MDIEAVMFGANQQSQTLADAVPQFTVIAAKPTNISLKSVLAPYAISQFVSALVGGFGTL